MVCAERTVFFKRECGVCGVIVRSYREKVFTREPQKVTHELSYQRPVSYNDNSLSSVLRYEFLEKWCRSSKYLFYALVAVSGVAERVGTNVFRSFHDSL